MKKFLAILLTILACTAMYQKYFVKKEEPYRPVYAFVIEKNEAYPDIDWSAGELDKALDNAIQNNGSAAVIIADSKPGIDYRTEFKPYDKHYSKRKRSKLDADRKKDFIKACEDIKCQPETDIFTAIRKAGNELKSYSDATEYNMYVISSFIQTSGPYSFANDPDLICSEEKLIMTMAGNFSIPDLGGINVTLCGVGAVSDDFSKEQEVSDTAINHLENLSQLFFEETSCRLKILPNIISGPSSSDTAKTVVNLCPDTVEKVITPLKLTFIADKAEFTDIQAAQAEVASSAALLKSQPGAKLYLYGLVVETGTNDAITSQKLSLERAQAVKELYVNEEGCSPNQLVCYGLGYEDNSLRVNDRNPDGSLNQEAYKNRTVWALGIDTASAKGLPTE